MLPVIQQFTNALVGMGESLVESAGLTVSCKAGCGACCRQLVPVSETEAFHLRDLVEAMPEPRRTEVKARFAAALARLAEAGLLRTLRNTAAALATPGIGMEYFRLGIACPFLEDESCSIHADRPLSCREYLVTSPAENCRDPAPATVRRVPTPGFAMTSFASLDGPGPGGKGVRWVPLVLAPDWADEHIEPPPVVAGTELFTRFVATLTKLEKKIPPPAEVVPQPQEGST
jgi:Fe-S-cluster containining protein